MPTTRYCRPKAAPPETFEQFLVARFPYGDLNQWRDYIARGFAWIDRPSARKRGRNAALAGQQEIGGEESTVAQPPPQFLRIANATETLQQGDMIHFDPPASMEPPVDEENLTILDDDDDWVVCAKNGSIPVAEGGRYIRHTLCHVLTTRMLPTQTCNGSSGAALQDVGRDNAGAAGRRLFPVHRLDKETSGVVVLAKSSAAAALLADQFHRFGEASGVPGAREPPEAQLDERRFVATKEYEALLVGVMDHHWWEITAQKAAEDAAFHSTLTRWGITLSSGELCVAVTARVGPSTEDPCAPPSTLAMLRMSCLPVASSLGKTACTVFHVIRTSVELGITRVRIELHTGRTHQIRLHAALLGFPVLGDKMYCTSTPQVPGGLAAVDDATFLALTRGEMDMKVLLRPATEGNGEVFAVPRRHLLHACRLLIHHPRTRQLQTFVAPAFPWFEKDVSFSLGEHGNRLLRALCEES